MNGITTRLHWTDQPYKWHINDGQEVFVVLDGQVQMRYREEGLEKETLLEVGDIFYASVGTEHVAHPLGVARILVIEIGRECLMLVSVKQITVRDITRYIDIRFGSTMDSTSREDRSSP